MYLIFFIVFLLLIVTASTSGDEQYSPPIQTTSKCLYNFSINPYPARRKFVKPSRTYLQKHLKNSKDYGAELRMDKGCRFSVTEMPGNIFAYHPTRIQNLRKNAEGKQAGTYNFGTGYESSRTSRQKFYFLEHLLQIVMADAWANPFMKARAETLLQTLTA